MIGKNDKGHSVVSNNIDERIQPIIDSAKFKSKFDERGKANQDNDEWLDILRHSGLTPEELDRLAKNKSYSKVIEAIEMLSRLLVDKNLQIRLLEQENESLNQKNMDLNKENINIFQQNIDLKKRLEKLMRKNNSNTEDFEDHTIVYRLIILE
jgi:hypothetical protein